MSTQGIQALRTRVWGTMAFRHTRGEDGATLIEYILLVALIAVVCIVAIAFLGTQASSKFSSFGNNVQSS